MLMLLLMHASEISANNKPNSHNNYRNDGYYDNSFPLTHFPSCLLKRIILLRPFCEYLFSLKCLRAQKEKNYVYDKGSAGDDPDSSSI